ncbi:MAG: hypothetical protein ACFFE6_08615 [Candidatus Thorarchaeota archaeon]
MSKTNQILIDCFDANGFYEENYKRIILVMSKLTESKQLDREWVSSQAVGGTWARSIRCSFDTYTDARTIKELMVGLEYCGLDEVPKEIHPKSNSEIFRFADIDVLEVVGKQDSTKRKIAGRLKVGEKKIGIGDVREGNSDTEFVLTCRRKLIVGLDETSRHELYELEKIIYDQLRKAVI